jgi:hypothetical protein
LPDRNDFKDNTCLHRIFLLPQRFNDLLDNLASLQRLQPRTGHIVWHNSAHLNHVLFAHRYHRALRLLLAHRTTALSWLSRRVAHPPPLHPARHFLLVVCGPARRPALIDGAEHVGPGQPAGRAEQVECALLVCWGTGPLRLAFTDSSG